jgi:S1-C subfamily serine protease
MGRFYSFIVVACLIQIALPSQANDATPSSVVKIETVLQNVDPMAPWKKHSSSHSGGSGVVIDGKRILTNAHVVLYATDILVQPDHSSEKWAATIEAIAPGVDLAVLKLEDESFFKSHRPIARSPKLPEVQAAVTVYGYPQGGSDLSITKGIVSRIEFDTYWYDVQGLRIQVDAAINPGNSGGPALVDGKLIGIVFSKLSQADNIGYIIPCEEIDLFLNDIADGRYDGKPVLLDVVRHLENSAIRSRLGLERAVTGVLVTGAGNREADYPLRSGDIITRIGDHTIDNSGMVRVEQDRIIDFHYLVQRVAQGNKVGLTVLRDGHERPVEVPVGADRDQWLCPYLQGNVPAYFIYGPLAFSEASRELVQGMIKDPDTTYYLAYRNNALIVRYGERPKIEDERLVFVAALLPHRIFKGYATPSLKVVGEVNGVQVRNLKHLIEILRDATGEYTEFTFIANHPERIVFKRQEALRATEEVLDSNGIRNQCSADLMTVWQRKGK